MTYIGGQQYLLSYKVVQCTFAFCSGIGMEGPIGYYSISKCSVKGRLMELNCMEHFPIFAIVAHGCVWKHDMEMFF